MTAQEVKSIIYKWKTTVDVGMRDSSKVEKDQRLYALKIIGYILNDIQDEDSKQ
jgi:hypothetical protein